MKRRSSAVENRYSPFKLLPCLRCGQLTVAAIIPQPVETLELTDLECKRCFSSHFLLAKKRGDMWWAVYDRDTRRYSFDNYGEFPHLRMELREVSHDSPGHDDAPYPGRGPVLVYKRRRFTKVDARQIWIHSGCKCHLCGKPWKVRQRSRKGWHIDHLIPNIGGGKETEMMDNFRVACATCNLKKGRGYTERLIKQALQSLFD